MTLFHSNGQLESYTVQGRGNRRRFGSGGMFAAMVMVLVLLGVPGLARAGGGEGYNTVTVVNCTKGDGVGYVGDKDFGVLYLTFKSYNAWDEEMKWAFTAFGQTGVVQNVDPGESATLNCLQKEGLFDTTTYNACKVLATKSGFPDTVETLADGGTYYFTGLTTSDQGTFETTQPGHCE